MDPTQIVSLGAAAGAGSIVALALKALVLDKRGEGTAMIDGINKGLETGQQQLDEVKLSFDRRLDEVRAEHLHDLDELRHQLDQLRAALIKFLPLVDPSKIGEAAEILVSLQLTPPRH